MKTLILTGAGGVKTTVKAQMGACSLEELDTIGYDTQFTAMTIENDDASIIAGAEVSPQVYSWVALRAQASAYSLTLTAIDLNPVAGGAGSVEITL